MKLLSVTFLILRGNGRDIVIKVLHTSSRKVPVILVRFKNKFNFLDRLKKSNLNFHENLCSGSRVIPCGQMDRQTDMTKITIAFRNFANTSKMLIFQTNSSLCVSYPYLCT